MSIPPGTRLGPYEILAPLGAGGMGEVYKANDSRVGRAVALKVLPGDFLEGKDGGERKERFGREARALASLNHPGIATLYSFEEISGRHVLVMELLEGESLLSRLAEGPLAPRRATELAVQIAQGLAAAHEKGIVHRDLKPGNLWITKEGRIKILDFGLAKKAPQLLSKADTALPTADATPGRPTSQGVILGTLGYMSPEQVRAETLDSRSDIFSFGVVLFEMLTGRRAFERKTAADTLAAILKEDPPEPEETGRPMPPGLRRIVDRCLEKSPARRFQSAQDLAFALEATQGATSETGARAAAVSASRRFLRGALLAAAAAILLGLAFLAGWKTRPASAQPRYTQVTYLADAVDRARFTRDGRSVVFHAGLDDASRVYVQAIGDPIPRRILEQTAFLASVSPSDELAVLVPPWDWGSTLGTCPLGGALPRVVSKNVRDAAWSPDGKALCIIRREKNGCRIEYPEGKTLLRTEGGEFTHPRLSPDGRHLALLKHPEAGDTAGTVLVLELATGESRDLTPLWADLTGLAWSSGGQEIWFSGAKKGLLSEVFAADLRGKVRRVLGAPTRLRLEDVVPDGRVLLAREDDRVDVFVHHVVAASTRRLSMRTVVLGQDLSRDGRLALLCDQTTSAAYEHSLWVSPTDGTLPVRLCQGVGGRFAPDGAHVLVSRTWLRKDDFAVVPTAGGPESVLRTEGLSILNSPLWSPKQEILVLASRAKESKRIWRIAPDSPPVPLGPPLPPEAFYFDVPDPKGRIALVRMLGRSQAWIDLEDPASAPKPTAVNWDPEEWRSHSADGVWCYTLRKDKKGAPHQLGRLNLRTGTREILRTIDLTGGNGRVLYTQISDDGSKILFTAERATSDLYVVEGLK